MGACSISVRASGKSMQDAFQKAQRIAEREYGDDLYNGQINNCSLIGDVSSKRSNFAEDDYFETWILDNTSKRDVKGYCTSKPIENNNKIKTVVENFPQVGTRKWITKYFGIEKFTGTSVCNDVSQTECIKKARIYVEKHPDSNIDIVIKKVLEEGHTKVATITYKKAINEKNGTYVFVG